MDYALSSSSFPIVLVFRVIACILPWTSKINKGVWILTCRGNATYCVESMEPSMESMGSLGSMRSINSVGSVDQIDLREKLIVRYLGDLLFHEHRHEPQFPA